MTIPDVAACTREPLAATDVNISGTQTVLVDIATNDWIRRTVLVSSASIRGDGTPEETRDQDLLTVRQVRDLTHVDDITEGTLRALTSSVRRMENHLLSRGRRLPPERGRPLRALASTATAQSRSPSASACASSAVNAFAQVPSATPTSAAACGLPSPTRKCPGNSIHAAPARYLNAIASITCR
ncbi:hypothetical protein ACFYP6_38645 [Streptomyces goshikiensis]|uniref:hypothetical protein n=1 Tax=Streptomyces goshikiensis TaxID=1942 RepID=UPI0036CFC334